VTQEFLHNFHIRTASLDKHLRMCGGYSEFGIVAEGMLKRFSS
jgi:hypothetical protein